MAGPAQHRRPTAAMSAGPLATLLLDEAMADRPLAISGGHVMGLRRFRADVSTAAARRAPVHCRSGLVACDDAYWAAVGLFALAHSGAATILSPNVLPATLKAIAGTLDTLRTDGAVQRAERVLTMATVAGSIVPLPPMDAERACVPLFTSGATGAP